MVILRTARGLLLAVLLILAVTSGPVGWVLLWSAVRRPLSRSALAS